LGINDLISFFRKGDQESPPCGDGLRPKVKDDSFPAKDNGGPNDHKDGTECDDKNCRWGIFGDGNKNSKGHTHEKKSHEEKGKTKNSQKNSPTTFDI